MTSFQQLTSDFPMVEQNDDIMEDSMYAERQDQALDDIDVDFEFGDDAAEDAQMVESGSYLDESLAPTANAVVDKDDEMADEEQENTAEDHEIVDAPPQVHDSAIEATAAEVLMTEQPSNSPSQLETDVFVDDIVDLDHPSEVQFQEKNSEQASRAIDIEQPGYQNGDPGESRAVGKGATQERDVQVVLDVPTSDTLVADEITGNTPFEENEDGTALVKLRTITDADLTTAASTIIVHGPSESISSRNAAGTLENEKDVGSQNPALVVHAGSKGNPSALERTDDSLEAQEPIGLGTTMVTAHSIGQSYSNQTSTVAAVNEGKTAQVKDDEQSVADESTDDEDFEQLSIVVEYDGQELSLFTPRSDDATDTFLLSDVALMEQDLKTLLSACRPVIGAGFPDEEEIVIQFPSLGLEIAESAAEATTTSLAQLRDLYLHLSHNDGNDKADALRLELFTRRKVSAQLQLLQSLINEGKGLKELAGDDLSDQEDNREDAGEVNAAEADELHADDVSEGGGLQVPHKTDTEYNPSVEGLAQSKDTIKRDQTPGPDYLLGKDDPFDFRSPLRQPHENNSGDSGTGSGLHGKKEADSSHAGIQPTHAGFDASIETPGDDEADFHHLFPEDSALVQGDFHQQQDTFGDIRADAFYDGAVGHHTLVNNEVNGQGVSTRSSTLLEGEDDFSANDYEQDIEGTNTNSLHEVHTKDTGGPASFPHDDGFDFDEFVQDTDNGAGSGLPEEEPTADSNEGLYTNNPATPGHDVVLETLGTKHISPPQAPTVPEEDEIDFSDDDKPEQVAKPAASAPIPDDISIASKKQSDSLKRSHPYDDEDEEALAESPSGLKRQRSG